MLWNSTLRAHEVRNRWWWRELTLPAGDVTTFTLIREAAQLRSCQIVYGELGTRTFEDLHVQSRP